MGLTLVDSSVLIDLLLDRDTIECRHARQLLNSKQGLAVGDLMVMEVLQGSRSDRAFATARTVLSCFPVIAIVDHAIAVQAARFYRMLRAQGITVRKTIDTLIATRCIVDDLPLLYADRDFDRFVEHFGLRSALTSDTIAS